ncbi:protein suex-1-like [Vespa velutina]|uniref:protein suex-1-like n=1 Tax=Vespa velutina TaxID=202808 RepID=UPI001FB35CE1|nr:protein suex-1-like [Vespa velutina]
MKLLLLLGLIILVFGQETIVSTRSNDNKEIEQQATTILQVQPNSQEGEANRKLTKRSFGWGPWGYGGGYGGYGWPWYGGWGGGWYGGWYPGWPWWYGGYGGWYGHGGWYKKW